MFGAIVAGRLVQTNLQQIDETHFVFPLEQPYEINHLTVFLLGSVPFPEGYGASVHFAWPGGEYIPLGVLTNAKPSAIYRVRPLLPPHQQQGGVGGVGVGAATLGIEISPLQQLEHLQATLDENKDKGKGKEVAGRVVVGQVAEKVVRNLFNYLHSFGGEIKLTGDTPIPLSVFEKWYANFLRKIENDRGAAFLDRTD